MTDASAPSSEGYWLYADKIRFHAVQGGQIVTIGECEPMKVTWSDEKVRDDWSPSDGD